jgi:type VI secretion system protein ImpF
MARHESEVRITLSIVDRLLDYEPDISREPPPSRAKSLRLLKQAVRRDLECLLNTRQFIEDVPAGLQETNRSLAKYGLPDFSAFNVKSTSDQSVMRRMIEDQLRLFEPRLMDPVVTVEASRDSERALHFRIEARLKVDPAPEPVTFDTMLHLHSGEYTVQGD